MASLTPTITEYLEDAELQADVQAGRAKLYYDGRLVTGMERTYAGLWRVTTVTERPGETVLWALGTRERLSVVRAPVNDPSLYAGSLF